MNKTRVRVGVVGGGAAGIMAAITAAESGAFVTLFEGGERVGKKILSTGNGKCNFGNRILDPTCYYGAARTWLQECLSQFDTDATVRFFAASGMLIKEKNGYLYPLSEQASTVLDVLRTRLRTAGVQVVTGKKGTRVEAGFTVYTGDEPHRFDRVILACGGKAAPKTGSDGSGYLLAKELGHRIVPVVPALVQLRCRETFMKEIAGVRADAVVRVLSQGPEEIAERGELQLTDYGISGIPVFQMSRRVNYIQLHAAELHPHASEPHPHASGKASQEVEVSIDFLPDYTLQELEDMLKRRLAQAADRTVEEFFTGLLNKKLMLLMIKLAGLKRDVAASTADRQALYAVLQLCKAFTVHVTGSNSFDNAQVCAGGVDTAQVGTDMQSRLVQGLYFAGEMLDVDGRCGGYNLQWAWCSGHIAGRQAAGCSASAGEIDTK